MEHAAHVASALFLKNGQRVVGSLARVDSDRLAKLVRERDRPSKHLPLHLARAEVIVVIEPDLPNRHHPGMTRQTRELVPQVGGERRGLVRVQPHDRNHVGATLREGNRVPRRCGVASHADRDEAGHARGARTLEHRVGLLPLEVAGIEMAMAVHEHDGRGLEQAGAGCHRERPPPGVSYPPSSDQRGAAANAAWISPTCE